jgi:hypothetical protein
MLKAKTGGRPPVQFWLSPNLLPGTEQSGIEKQGKAGQLSCTAGIFSMPERPIGGQAVPSPPFPPVTVRTRYAPNLPTRCGDAGSRATPWKRGLEAGESDRGNEDAWNQKPVTYGVTARRDGRLAG